MKEQIISFLKQYTKAMDYEEYFDILRERVKMMYPITDANDGKSHNAAFVLSFTRKEDDNIESVIVMEEVRIKKVIRLTISLLEKNYTEDITKIVNLVTEAFNKTRSEYFKNRFKLVAVGNSVRFVPSENKISEDMGFELIKFIRNVSGFFSFHIKLAKEKINSGEYKDTNSSLVS